MNRTSIRGSGGTSFFLFALTLILLTGGPIFPSTTRAQELVVAPFSSRRAGKLARQAREKMLRSLDRQGASLVSYRQYLGWAKRFRLRGRKALSPYGIARITHKMNLDAVVTGSAYRKGKRFRLVIMAYNADGKRIISKIYNLRWQALPTAAAGKLAATIVAKLGGGKALDEISLSVSTPAAKDPEVEPAPVSNLPDKALPAWTRNQATAKESQPRVAAKPKIATSKALPKKKKAKTGSVPDTLLAAGMSGNLRAGLQPRHESTLHPGVRVDARVFLGSFLDLPFVRDLALGGLFNTALALKYGPQGEDEEWSSSMYQWQAELTYRLGLDDVHLKPAFLLRLGYGSTINTIDTDNEAAVSVGYGYPYTALEIYITLWRPYLRLFAGGGYLFMVSTSKDLSGTGWGFTARGGLDLVLFSQFHIGAGYEMWQFKKIEVADTGVSDTFQTFFLRLGWSYH